MRALKRERPRPAARPQAQLNIDGAENTPETGATQDLLRDRRRGVFWLENELIGERSARLGPIALAVYVVLARHAGPEGTAFPAIGRLAECAGISRTSAKQAIQRLVAEGLLSVSPRHSSSGGASSNLYSLEALRPSPKTETPPVATRPGVGRHTTPKEGFPKESPSETSSPQEPPPEMKNASEPTAQQELVAAAWKTYDELQAERPAAGLVLRWAKAFGGDAERFKAALDELASAGHLAKGPGYVARALAAMAERGWQPRQGPSPSRRGNGWSEELDRQARELQALQDADAPAKPERRPSVRPMRNTVGSAELDRETAEIEQRMGLRGAA